MKITEVETIFVDRYLLVKIHTDAGHTGLGEAGAWAFLEACDGAVMKFARYLIGKDPLQIEHHWNFMYRAAHFRGAVVMGALSALDIALWDIAGKHFGVPVYQLLGGKVRDKARVYYHVFGDTTEKLVNGIVDARKKGFTAVGHLTPFLDSQHDVTYEATHVRKIRDAIDTVRQYREAVGDEVDLCMEISRKLTPTEAVQLGLGIEEFHPYFYEDPVTPHNFDEMVYVANKVNIPIATGERFTSVWEFEMLLRRDAVQYVRPDVCNVGGITGSKKIAALAEANHVGVVPHNPLSPVSTAACLQIAACIPNFALQELPIGEDQSPKTEMFSGIPVHDGRGYLVISDEPGIGIELKPDAVEKAPPRLWGEVRNQLSEDGSITFQ